MIIVTSNTLDVQIFIIDTKFACICGTNLNLLQQICAINHGTSLVWLWCEFVFYYRFILVQTDALLILSVKIFLQIFNLSWCSFFVSFKELEVFYVIFHSLECHVWKCVCSLLTMIWFFSSNGMNMKTCLYKFEQVCILGAYK